MTKEELFKKYSIDESHNVWDYSIDSWMRVEIYREMHEGKLPQCSDLSLKYVIDFLNKANSGEFNVLKHPNGGSFYLTAKRLVYKYSEEILKEINS